MGNSGVARPPDRLPASQRVLLAVFVVLWCTGLVLILMHR